jgi:hypothetical protein
MSAIAIAEARVAAAEVENQTSGPLCGIAEEESGVADAFCCATVALQRQLTSELSEASASLAYHESQERVSTGEDWNTHFKAANEARRAVYSLQTRLRYADLALAQARERSETAAAALVVAQERYSRAQSEISDAYDALAAAYSGAQGVIE